MATDIDQGGSFIVEFGRISQEEAERKFGVSSKKGSQKSSQKIFEAIAKNPQITIAELSELLGISDRAIKKNISNLKKAWQIKRVGPDKGGYWQTINNS